MIFCPHCDLMNSEQEVYCANCGKPLKDQPSEIEHTVAAPAQPSANNVQRNAIVGCCALSLLLFFIPLLTIQVPIAGQQDVSGYDVFSKLTEFREKLTPPDSASPTNSNTATPRTPPPDMPLSIQFGWLIPLALIVAFLSAAIALITAFKAIQVSRILCVVGAVCAGAAILHITIMNSDIHSWLAESMKTMQSELKDNPFAGFAQNLGTLIVNAFQIKPGWGAYGLLVLLGLAAVIGFSRLFSHLRVAPADS
jgi:hypothetical protein